jgi:hypothetical protein
MRNSSLFLIQVALIVSIYLFLGTGGVSAQSGNKADLTTGQIVFIDPTDPKGALKVKRAKGGASESASIFMPVRRGYLLTLAPNAKAQVICGDGKVRDLAPGLQGCPCTVPCNPDLCSSRYEGSRIGPMRGPDTDIGLFPVVISPRKTVLKTLRPTIRWTPIVAAKESTTYNVIVYGEGMKVIWTRDVVFETSLKYPDEEPPLTPGRNYKVVVTSEGMSSQQDKSPGLGFITLTAVQAQTLAAEEARRKQLNLPEAQKRFLLSNLYVAGNLYAEAIEQLEDIYTALKEPAFIVRLGDLYAAIGLNREAEKKYLDALKLTLANDYEGLGLIQKNLAQVSEALGFLDIAIARLGEAIKAYRQLKHQAMIKALLKKEQELKKMRGSK